MSEAIRVKVNEQLQAWNIAQNMQYQGVSNPFDSQEMDSWRVTFNKQTRQNPAKPYVKESFEYHSGFGLRNKAKTKYDTEKPKAPQASDVLYCLLLDSQAANESFNDWCDNFGYSSDSISAFNTYQACCNTAKQLRNIFTAQQIQELQTLLQDY